MAMLLSAGAALSYVVQPSPMVAAPTSRSAVQMAANADWKTTGMAAALALATGVQAASAGPFTRSEIASLTYDQIKGTDSLLGLLTAALNDYNEQNAAMDLVFFEDAMKHISRVARIISNSSGLGISRRSPQDFG